MAIMEDIKTKSFWQKPEGTTGMLMLAGAGVGLFFAAPILLALVSTLAALVGQTLMLVVLGTVLFLFLNIIFNKKVQILVRMGFKSVMRWITKWFVEIDPIGIMKNYVSMLADKLQIMDDGRNKLRGQIKILEKKIQETDGKYDNAMATMKVAQDKGMKGQMAIQGKQAGRMEKLSKATLAPLLTMLQVHLRALNKYYEVTEAVIEDTKNEVEAKQIEREAITASYSVLMTAKKILNGGTDEKELFDMAMESVVNDLGMKVGEIEGFLENSKGFIDGLDLQNGVYEANALAKLQEWEAKADSVLLGNTKAQLLEYTAVNSPVYTAIGVSTSNQVDYADLIGKK